MPCIMKGNKSGVGRLVSADLQIRWLWFSRLIQKPQHPKRQLGTNGRFDVVGKDVGIRQIRIHVGYRQHFCQKLLVKDNSIEAECKSDRTTLTAFYRLTTFLKTILPSANCTFTKYIPEGKLLKSSSKSGFEGEVSCNIFPIKSTIWQ